jgi:hypothetical protein
VAASDPLRVAATAISHLDERAGVTATYSGDSPLFVDCGMIAARGRSVAHNAG